MCCQGPQFCHHDYCCRITEKHKLQGSLFTCQNVSGWVMTFHPLWPEKHLVVYIQNSLKVGLQRGEDAVFHPGKITIILISCIVTSVCSINSVLGEDWEVCAYSPKCSYPVGIIPSQERQSFTVGCEDTAELILWWNNRNDKIPWYCLVRWVVMKCHGREIFLNVSTEKHECHGLSPVGNIQHSTSLLLLL